MIRTIISLDLEDKRWLDRKAKESKTTIAAIVREAVHRMRQAEESPTWDLLIEQTKGLWTQGDGLAYQQAQRDQGS